MHDAIYAVKLVADSEFTDREWRPVLIGDKFSPKLLDEFPSGSEEQDLADLLWPNLAMQIFPRDAQNLDLKTCQIGDNIYSSVY